MGQINLLTITPRRLGAYEAEVENQSTEDECNTLMQVYAYGLNPVLARLRRVSGLIGNHNDTDLRVEEVGKRGGGITTPLQEWNANILFPAQDRKMNELDCSLAIPS